MNFVAAIEELFSVPSRCGSTHVVAIDGRAGAGKTTLAADLFLALSSSRQVTLIHMDEVYEGWKLGLSDSLAFTLSNLLRDISNRRAHQLPIYDWKTQTFSSFREILVTDILILEGVGSAQKVVREFAAATIWLDIDPITGLKRVLERDGISIQSHMIQWQIDEEAHHRREETRESVDFVLSTLPSP